MKEGTENEIMRDAIEIAIDGIVTEMMMKRERSEEEKGNVNARKERGKYKFLQHNIYFLHILSLDAEIARGVETAKEGDVLGVKTALTEILIERAQEIKRSHPLQILSLHLRLIEAKTKLKP